MVDISAILIVTISYLVGAIPTGYFVSWVFGAIDITQHGSGNPGATNVARVLGAVYFIPIFLIDAGKAYLTLYYVQKIGGGEWLLFISVAALLVGNSYSVFLRGGGGKGVATSFGCIAFFLPLCAVLCAMCLWLLIGWLTKHAFLGSLGTFFLLFIARFVYTEWSVQPWFLLLLWVWLVMRHSSNVRSFLRTWGGL